MSGLRDADELSEGRAALRRADWPQARAAFTGRVDRDADDAAALDGLASALWWLGEQEEATARRSEAYALAQRRGDSRMAAGIALQLAAEYRLTGELGEGAGWLARAESLLEGTETSAELGRREIERAAATAGDADAHASHARAAVEIARDLRDRDLEAAALAQLGLARIDDGEVEPGMSLLDEAMTLATSAASDPFAIGDTCHTTLAACERLADFGRAADWCRVVVEFTGRRGYTRVHLWCRTVYAGVLTITGDWARAERELAAALRGYEAMRSGDRAFAIGRLVTLRSRQGRLGEARSLLRGSESDPRTTAGATALALAEHDIGRASRLLERSAEAGGGGPASLALLLPAVVDARVAAGALDAATEALERLRGLGERLARPDLLALAQHDEARIAEARGDERDALAGFELAMARFARLGMPLEEARARLELARLESGELAALHARTALAIFERLGARIDADAAGAVLRNLGVSGRSAPRIEGELTSREREVLELLGEGLTNQAIAERLVISPRTAEHHVGRILGKLGLRRRAEAAAYAMREGHS